MRNQAAILRRVVFPVLMLVVVPFAGCGRASSPLAPSAAAALAGHVADAGPVGVTGIVAAIDLDRRSFTVSWRGGSRVVRVDADTVVWSQASNSRVRLTALRTGQSVAVRGTDYGRYVLARSIVIGR